MQSKRIEWLDVAKGGSIILVAVYHATLYLDAYDLSAYSYTMLNDFFRPIRMPLFFAVSGVLAASALSKSWAEVFFKKILLFLYLLLLWKLVRWVFFGSVLQNVRAQNEGSSYAELARVFYNPSSEMWFIWALAVFFFVARALSGLNHAAVLSAAIVVSVLTFGSIIDPESYTHRNLLWYFPFFLLGAWSGRQGVQWISEYPMAIGLVSVAMFIALHIVLSDAVGLTFGTGRFIQSCLGLSLGATISVLISRWHHGNRTFAYFGKNTLPIYVTHVLIIAPAAAALAVFLSGAPYIKYWGVPVVAATAIAVSLVLQNAAMRLGATWLYSLPRHRRA